MSKFKVIFNKYIASFLIVLFLGIGLILLNLVQRIKGYEEELSHVELESKIAVDLMRESLFSSLSFNSTHLNNLTIKTESPYEVALYALNDKYHLLYWTNSNHCFACVESSLAIYRDFHTTHENCKMAIVTDYKNKKQLNLLLDKLELEVDSYYYYDENIFENVLNPAFFCIDPNGYVNGFYTPFKEIPELTEEYLKFSFQIRQYLLGF